MAFFYDSKLGDGDYKVKFRSAKIMERMVNQNTNDDINHGLDLTFNLFFIMFQKKFFF